MYSAEFLLWNWPIIDLFYRSNLHCKYCLCTNNYWRHLQKKLLCQKQGWKITKYNLKFWDDLSYEYQHWVHHTCTKKTNFLQFEETFLLFFDSTLGPVQYYNIHRTGWFIENRCTAWKNFHPLFIQVNFISEKVRSKAPLSIQWARGQESLQNTHKKCLRK